MMIKRSLLLLLTYGISSSFLNAADRLPKGSLSRPLSEIIESATKKGSYSQQDSDDLLLKANRILDNLAFSECGYTQVQYAQLAVFIASLPQKALSTETDQEKIRELAGILASFKANIRLGQKK